MEDQVSRMPRMIALTTSTGDSVVSPSGGSTGSGVGWRFTSFSGDDGQNRAGW
jgi:hypothetical protein